MQKVQTINRNGLVGEWLLDGNALDTSGSGNNGTATNVTYTGTDRGYQSQTGVLDGTAYITCGNILDETGANPFSLCFKGKFNATGTTMILGKQLSSGTFGGYMIWWNGSTLDFSMVSNDGTFNRIEILYSGLTSGINYDMVLNYDGSKLASGVSLYANNVLITPTVSQDNLGTKSCSNTGSFSIGCRDAGNLPMNGNIQTVRKYNRIQSKQEIQSLYMEGLRKLGGAGLAPLTDGLVAMFETDGSTPLYEVIGGTTATLVGGTATTDYFGATKAISNPNYTWTSITYTTGYTFENSGGGWALVTSPAGLSATGINRTTTLGRIFLFNRTLSASEVTVLEILCKNSYPYPF